MDRSATTGCPAARDEAVHMDVPARDMPPRPSAGKGWPQIRRGHTVKIGEWDTLAQGGPQIWEPTAGSGRAQRCRMYDVQCTTLITQSCLRP